MKTRIAAVAAVVAAAVCGTAVPAFAGPTPGPTTNQQATISVPETLSLTTTLPASFSLTAANNTPALAQGGGTITVQTNDPNGYTVDLNGPQNNFTGQNNSGNQILINLVKANTATNGWSSLVYPPSVWYSANQAPSSANGDQYTFQGFYIPALPSNQAPDTYGGQINWTLWGQ